MKVVSIEKIRISIGTASVLELGSIPKFKDSPSTCYIMTYKSGHCTANCAFCPQARSSKSSEEMLSRVSWPIFKFKDFLIHLRNLNSTIKFKRICVQTLNYQENFRDLREIVIKVKENTNIPISVAIPPMTKEKLKQLKMIGVERIGIALDGATPEIFNKIKGEEVNGPYNWNEHMENLKEALEIFSEGNVSTHIIIGLGETEKDVIERIEQLNNLKILVSLFAFTPIRGTKLEIKNQPSIMSFRKIQLGRYLIVNKNKSLNDFKFNKKGNLIKIDIDKPELEYIVNYTDAFLTSGCPGCNRPYYTSKPSGPIYNYPRKLTESEKKEIYNKLLKVIA